MCCYSGPDGPIFEVRISAKFAFAEFRRLEDAANCLNLNGIPYLGVSLKINRPSKYEGGVGISHYTWDEVLVLWQSGIGYLCAVELIPACVFLLFL